MKKRWILAAALALAAVLGTALAAEEAALSAEPVWEFHALEGAAETDPEALFGAYVERAFYGEEEASLMSWGETKFAAGTTQRRIYDALRTHVTLLARTGGWTSFTYALPSKVTFTCAPANFWTELDRATDVAKIYNAVLNDCPYDCYWHDKTVVSYGAQRTSKDEGSGMYTYTVTALNFPLPVAEAYQEKNCDDPARTLTTGVSAVGRAAAKAKQIVEDCKDLGSDYEKLLAYNNIICSLTEYNHPAIASDWTKGYADPWQLIYTFDGDPSTNIVCEGYAKSFQYLCDMTEFEGLNGAETKCYIVTGDLSDAVGAGPHMWNVVSLGGKNYLVDVTNSDVGSISDLFLVGSTTAASGGSGGGIANGYSFSMGTRSLVRVKADGSLLRGNYNAHSVPFLYDDETKALYGTGSGSILNLSATSFTRPASTSFWNADVAVGYNGIAYQEVEFTYDGTAQVPYVGAVRVNGSALTLGTDYTVSYANNVNATDNAGVVITGQGDYAGMEIQRNFRILPRELTVTAATLAPKTYDGTTAGEVTGVTFSGLAEGESLIPGVDYTAKAVYDSAAAGTGRTAAVTVTLTRTVAASNYTLGTAAVTVSGADISPRDLSGEGFTLSFTDSGDVEVRDGAKALTKVVDFTVYVSGQTVTVTGTGNYTGTVTMTRPASYTGITSSGVTWGSTALTYTGLVQGPTVTVRAGGATLTRGADYTVLYTDETGAAATPMNVGTYTAVVMGQGSYIGTARTTFTIGPATLKLVYTSDVTAKDKVYDGSCIARAEGVDFTGLVNGETLSLGTDYTARITYTDPNVGTGKRGTVTIELLDSPRAGNYVTATGEKSVVYSEMLIPSSKIVPRPIDGEDITAALSRTSYVYDGSFHMPAAAVSRGWVELASGTDFSLSYSDCTNAGTGKVTVTGTGNYTGSRVMEFTIKPKPLTDSDITVTLPASVYYTGQGVEPAAEVKRGTAALTAGIDFTLSYADNVNVGTATVTITGRGNYTGTVPRTFAVVPPAVTAAAVAVTEEGAKVVLAAGGLLENTRVFVTFFNGSQMTACRILTVARLCNETAELTAECPKEWTLVRVFFLDAGFRPLGEPAEST